MKRVFILGGGAALGAHQVGALKYLAEQGITPDAFVASSIGVLNACVYGSGGIDRLEDAWRDFRSIPRIFSPSFWQNPLLGLSFFSMDRLSSALEEYIDFPVFPLFARHSSLLRVTSPGRSERNELTLDMLRRMVAANIR